MLATRIVDLPIDVVMHSIASILDGKDKLALAKTNKTMYRAITVDYFPDLQQVYGMKWKIGKCVRDMMDFIKHGGPVKASWSLSYNWHVFAKKPGHCIRFCKTGKNQHVTINARVFNGLNEIDVLNWIESHLLPNWDYVELSTDCRYRIISKQLEYKRITNEMMVLLSHSLPQQSKEK